MLNKLKNLILGKRVLVLGFGKEGKSTYRTLKAVGGYACLDIADRADIAPGTRLDANTRVLTGPQYLDLMNTCASLNEYSLSNMRKSANVHNSLDNYDLVFKSPGVVLSKALLNSLSSNFETKVTSQTEIFLEVYRDQVIGATGTKGKSTVATLLYHVFTANGKDAVLAGNIGIPFFDTIAQIKKGTVIVLELSCHQLEFCEVSPHIALLLNIYQDHLDHYKTFENYARAKYNIYKYQIPGDIFLCRKDFFSYNAKGRVIPISPTNAPFANLDTIEGVRLRGAHNHLNCAFVFEVCKMFGIGTDNFIRALKTYKPLSHRLELLGTVNGVDYYDDSISTAVQSTISAIESIPNTKTVLLGGMDRGIDYTQLVEFLGRSSLDYVVLMYESGIKMYNMLWGLKTCNPRPVYFSDLRKAVAYIKRHAPRGSACILSPASASYGDFKNFEERGDVFRKLVFG